MGSFGCCRQTRQTIHFCVVAGAAAGLACAAESLIVANRG